MRLSVPQIERTMVAATVAASASVVVAFEVATVCSYSALERDQSLSIAWIKVIAATQISAKKEL